jgi:hypothetical protein
MHEWLTNGLSRINPLFGRKLAALDPGHGINRRER